MLEGSKGFVGGMNAGKYGTITEFPTQPPPGTFNYYLR